jgi:hypothetical protein
MPVFKNADVFIKLNDSPSDNSGCWMLFIIGGGVFALVWLSFYAPVLLNVLFYAGLAFLIYWIVKMVRGHAANKRARSDYEYSPSREYAAAPKPRPSSRKPKKRSRKKRR